MLEKEDLQAIRAIIKEEVAEAKQEITRDTVALMDAEFTPKFNLLAEGQAQIVERLDRLEEQVADIQSTLTVHQAAIRQHTMEIRELKKAQ